MINDPQRRLLALCLIRVDGKSVDWSLIARCALAGKLDDLCAGDIPEKSQASQRSLEILRAGISPSFDDLSPRIDEELDLARSVGARLVTVLDEEYPQNLRSVRDLPPFLFYRGDLQTQQDARSVAVVGTRDASDIGVSRARTAARELGEAGFTVTSGLARGIDTAAHTTALHHGRRTIAVLGTGITKCYPSENWDLAEKIAQEGVLASQFWPSRPPGRDTFPRRNHVTSGISIGTVVVEASRTSGAKMQARIAADQGRHVLLLKSLVDQQEWAKRMVESGRATMVSGTEQMIDSLVEPEPTLEQATDTQLTLDVQ